MQVRRPCVCSPPCPPSLLASIAFASRSAGYLKAEGEQGQRRMKDYVYDPCVSTGGVERADDAGMRRHSTVLLALSPSLLHKFTLTHSLSPLLMGLSIHVSGLEGAKEAEVKGAEVVVVATAVAAMVVAVEGHGGHYGLD
ncbi:hypothetical protein E2C01_034499 [Portunus trituberculatus]|uniref:Uncharacterized protein n=1 Tax=Portunus trituberculatus TaxID=210409 RepID=A0A5B7F8P2_PORTR|nr:hypothetical protein [Portunus trituberculatus]